MDEDELRAQLSEARALAEVALAEAMFAGQIADWLLRMLVQRRVFSRAGVIAGLDELLLVAEEGDRAMQELERPSRTLARTRLESLLADLPTSSPSPPRKRRRRARP